MGILYANAGKIYCNDYFEIYIPLSYFNDKPQVAINMGDNIETLGVVFCREFPKGSIGEIQLMNIPTIVKFMNYDSSETTIEVHGQTISVLALKYIKDSYIIHQTTTKGKDVAGVFLDSVLGARLPKSIHYNKLLDIWWKNLEMAGISYKVPSKIYELILASIYRNANNPKERYGEFYGKQTNPSGYDYKAENVRNVVKNLSTFSGIVFEDMSTMITSGINNSMSGKEEQVSPLEKIIKY